MCLFQPKTSSEKWFPYFLAFDATRKCWSTENLAIVCWLPARGEKQNKKQNLSSSLFLPKLIYLHFLQSSPSTAPSSSLQLIGFIWLLSSTNIPFTLHTLAYSLHSTPTPISSSTSDPTMVTPSATVSTI